jgi:hypothetical protein
MLTGIFRRKNIMKNGWMKRRIRREKEGLRGGKGEEEGRGN